MNLRFLRRLLLLAVLLLSQTLVLNHIHLFGHATPMLQAYFVLTFRRNYPKWAMLVWSFLLGLGVDTFSNTPGVDAGAMTLLALLQPYALALFLQRESEEDLRPGILSLGFPKFLTYALLLTLVHCLLFLTLETFTFFNWREWALGVGGSTLLSTVLVVVADMMRKER